MAVFPGLSLTLCEVYCKSLEKEKTNDFFMFNLRYDSVISLYIEANNHTKWWLKTLETLFKISICRFQAKQHNQRVIDGTGLSGDRWKPDDVHNVIVLELKVIHIIIQIIHTEKNNVKQYSEASYMKTKCVIMPKLCNEVVKKIWLWCTLLN